VAPVRTPIRCVIYTRQSIESNADLSSCQVQFDLCRAFIRSRRTLGYELIEERFADEGYSGATLDRPALHRLLSVIRSGGIERFVIYRLDRLSRNLRRFTTLFEELKDHAVELDVLNAPETGAVALDRFMLNVLALFSEFERDLAATRIAESHAHLKAHGRRIAGATPFGYFADRHTKQLVVCDEEAAAVARMFQWADAGVTPAVIASFANALRWITGAGNPWTARQVLSILTNHTYAGLVVHGFAFRDGCHQALVDRELYHRVQNLIIGRRTGVPGRRGGRATFQWVLRGILLCGKCDRPMSTHTVRFGPVVRCYYRCRSTAGGREPCKGVMISAGEVESAVLAEIGAAKGLTTKEQAGVVKEAVRSVVYDADSRMLKINRIESLVNGGGAARGSD
jgi:DNA invertase Pin-like site-specific DNA recombinase